MPYNDDLIIEHLQQTHATNSLTEREKHLLGLAVTMTRGCQVCTRNRIAKAREFGLTDDELNALVAITSAVNSGGTAATARVAIGMLEQEAGRYYRDKILAKGGTLDGLDLVEGYLGRPPSMDAFLESLGLEGEEPVAIDIPGTPVYGEPIKSWNGLESWIIEAGEGDTPLPTDLVKVHYTGWLEDGTKFDSSVDRGKPSTFPLNRVIPGWTEGVGEMRIGEKRKLKIPAEMAYGAQGRPSIPPNSTLIFDVELIDINPYSKVPPMEELPGDAVTGDIQSSDSGLQWYDIVEGEGEAPSSSSSNVEVHYTGWLTDGTKFDSSVDRGQTITFPLNGVIPGWTEGVGSMKVGGKRKLIIPSNLGYGDRNNGPIPGGATLIFDVELISTSK